MFLGRRRIEHGIELHAGRRLSQQSPDNGYMSMPFPDALQEFKVETSATGAGSGVKSAGSVSLVTKSGTNEFHGNLFEFVRNGMFNARNAFALAATPSSATSSAERSAVRSCRTNCSSSPAIRARPSARIRRTSNSSFRRRRCWPATLRRSLLPPATAAGRSR